MKNPRRILMMYTQPNYFTRSSLTIAIFSHLKKQKKNIQVSSLGSKKAFYVFFFFRALDKNFLFPAFPCCSHHCGLAKAFFNRLLLSAKP